MSASNLTPKSSSDSHGRFKPLLIALIVSIGIRPFLYFAIEPFVLVAIDASLMIAGVWAMSRKRWLVVFSIFVLVLFTGTNMLFLTGVRTSMAWNIALHAMLLCYLGMLVGYALWAIMQAGQVTVDTLVGSICVYLLIAFFFAGAFSMLELLEEGSLVVGEALGGTSQHMTWVPVRVEFSDTIPYRGASDLLYFSITTLTTLGYGDITPVSQKATALASVEAVIGQLYIAIMIARLVGMHIAHSTSPDHS